MIEKSIRRLLSTRYLNAIKTLLGMEDINFNVLETHKDVAYTIIKPGKNVEIFINPGHEMFNTSNKTLNIKNFLGVLIHEILHKKYTDPREDRNMVSRPIGKIINKPNLYYTISNIVEDFIIEVRCNTQLDITNKLRDLYQKAYKVDLYTLDPLKCLDLARLTSWRQSPPIKETDSPWFAFHNAMLQFILGPFVPGSKIPPAIQEDLTKILTEMASAIEESPKERAIRSKNIYDIVDKYIPMDIPEPQGSVSGTNDDAQKELSEEERDSLNESDRMKTIKKILKKAQSGKDGKPSKSKEGEPSEESGKEGSKSESDSSKKGEPKTSKGSSEKEDEKSEAEARDESGSSGSPTGDNEENGTPKPPKEKASSEEDEKDETAESGEKSDTNETDDPDGDSENKSDEKAEEPEEDEDESSSESEEANSSGESEEKETPESPEEEDPSEAEGKEDPAESEENSDKDETGDPADGSDKETEEPAESDSDDKSDAEDDADSPFACDEEMESHLKDLESEIMKEKVNVSELLKEAKEDEGKIYENTDRETEKVVIPDIPAYNGMKIKCKNYTVCGVSDETVKEYNKVVEENRKFINRFSKRMKNIINEEEQVETAKSGRLRLTRYAQKSKTSINLFEKTYEHERGDCRVLIMLDVSGSMNSRNKIGKAKTALVCIVDGLCRAGIPLKVMTFTEDSEPAVVHHHYVNYSLKKKNRSAIMQIRAGGNNFDGYSIRYGLKDLLKTKNKNTLMIVISDGQPASRFTCCNNADAAEAVKEAKRKTRVIGIGIDSNRDVLREFYEDTFIELTNLEDLMKTLGKTIVKEAKKWT